MMAKTEGPDTIYLKDYTRSPFAISEVGLVFNIGPDQVDVENTMKINRQTGGAEADLVLDGVNLEFQAAYLNGTKLPESSYQLEKETLKILNVPESFTLKIENRIYPKKNFALEGLYNSSGVYCTQNEPQGFRKITYFIDRPDVMAKYTTKIVAAKADLPLLLANGNKIESGDLPEGKHFAVWSDPFPKPSYLFALVAGNLGLVKDHFITKSGRKVALEIYVDRGNEDKCGHAMESLKKSMKWDEDTFGLEYDLDIYMIVAVDSFNFGAMENKGLNIFNSAYVLAKRETATDENFLGIEGVVAHEYFHNWTGNRVTCRDWFQLTLKEGLTVFRDQEFSADMNSRVVKRIQDVRTLKERQFPEDNGPLSHPIRPESYIQINNFYTATIYEKGAEVIRMIQTIIGKQNFKKGIGKYFELYDGQAVTTDDFVSAMEIASGIDLKLFKNWYTNAGTPRVKVEITKDREKGVVEIKCTQNAKSYVTKEDVLLHIPLVLGLLNEKGEVLNLNGQSEITLHLKNKTEVFTFPLKAERIIPSLNRDFSAPIFVDYNYSEDDLCDLLAFDPNFYNKYEAAQQLWELELHRQIQAIQQGSSLGPNEKLLKAIGHLLEQALIDPAFTAEVLVLPSEDVLNEGLAVCDFKNVSKAVLNLKKHLAQRFENKLLALIEATREKEFFLGPESMGKRALRNICWDILEVLEKTELQKAVDQEYYSANNMTDEIGAFALMMARENESSQKARQHFYQRWNKETLVMQKWLAVQARTMKSNVLEKLQALENDPVYNSKVPNLVRSLILSYVSFNLESFHAESGEGYQYLAKKIIELDTVNPQLASRLATKFKRFKNLDRKRTELIDQQLGQILAVEGLSKDTFEVVTKNLGQGQS